MECMRLDVGVPCWAAGAGARAGSGTGGAGARLVLRLGLLAGPGVWQRWSVAGDAG